VKIKATIRNEATGAACWGAPRLIYYALTVVGVAGFLALLVAATRFPNVGQQLRLGGLIWFFALGVARLGVQLWRGQQDA
jgi:hypothetical protein